MAHSALCNRGFGAILLGAADEHKVGCPESHHLGTHVGDLESLVEFILHVLHVDFPGRNHVCRRERERTPNGMTAKSQSANPAVQQSFTEHRYRFAYAQPELSWDANALLLIEAARLQTAFEQT